eukprot:m51a1_g2756 hypothetical protein (233) ;mRNA; r:968155-969030
MGCGASASPANFPMPSSKFETFAWRPINTQKESLSITFTWRTRRRPTDEIRTAVHDRPVSSSVAAVTSDGQVSSVLRGRAVEASAGVPPSHRSSAPSHRSAAAASDWRSEEVVVDLPSLRPEARRLVLLLHSAEGALYALENVRVSLREGGPLGRSLAEHEPQSFRSWGTRTGAFLGVVLPTRKGWFFFGSGRPLGGKEAIESQDDIQAALLVLPTPPHSLSPTVSFVDDDP